MRYIVGLLFCAIMLYLAWRKPPWALFGYFLTMATMGIQAYVSSITFSKVPQILQLIMLLVITSAGIKFWNEVKAGRQPYRVFFVSILIVGQAGLVFLGHLLIGSGIDDSLMALRDFNLLWFIPAMAYWRNDNVRGLLIAVLIIHLTLAAAMLIFPGGFLDNFSARQVFINAGVSEYGSTFELFNWNVSRFSSEQTLAMAHYMNPNSYVQVSGLGMIIGIWLCLKRMSVVQKIAGIWLVAVGVIGMMASFGRSSGLGLALGMGILLARRARSGIITVIFVAVSMLMVSYMLSGETRTILGEMYSTQASGVDYRLAALGATENNVARYGMFGISPTVYYSGTLEYYPHENITHVMLRFGCLAGLLVAFLEFASIWGGGSIYKRIEEASRNRMASCAPLVDSDDVAMFRACAVFMIVAGFANGFAGGYYYWMWFFLCCIPWLYSRQEWERYARTVPIGRSG